VYEEVALSVNRELQVPCRCIRVQKIRAVLTGRDLIGVQNLMKKHQALLAELSGHEPRIGTVCGQGEQMVKEGHFAGDDITSKIHELQDKWNGLKVI